MKLSDINNVKLGLVKSNPDFSVPTSFKQTDVVQPKKKKFKKIDFKQDEFLGQLHRGMTPFSNVPDIRRPPNIANIL